MKVIIQQRLVRLRQEMAKSGLDALYISGTDPHQSEYLPDYWQVREFISGFNGSAGFLMITKDAAALWTDSRYFLQATDQLAGTGIDLMKLRVEGTPSPAEWVGNLLPAQSLIGTDAACLSIAQFKTLKQSLASNDQKLTDCGDLMKTIWENRPPLPLDPIFEHDTKYTGRTRLEKIELIRQQTKAAKAQATLLTALDDIAWTFNLRGCDISYNPVFLSFALITETTISLYIDGEKVLPGLNQKLVSEGISVKEYAAIYEDLALLSGKILIDPDRTNQALLEAISPDASISYQLSIPTILKATKTDHELEMIKLAMRKDGIALVKFLYWLSKTVGTEEINEYDVLLKLDEFRATQDGFKGASFYSIVGYNGNGAIVHRSVTKETAAPIKAEGILLIDSGGQYLEGTTDITRTIALGKVGTLAKEDYTLVLKGTIGLAEVKFPANTPGANIDLAARQALWQTGRNYGHGTGHGIGFFLNVHEGPMSIRQEYNNRVIEPGMVISDEPAFYREGQYGIRTENVIACREWITTDYGRFLQFETLTLCPIDTRLIERKLLSESEINWLNDYHHRCYDELSPFVNDEEKEFLKQTTAAI
ncbi:aminopeptidase P family protein [Mangrovibacterium diazotrophicum]|uniref:Xaa-Pro aminopeptidase n=1 Tax=Mangrovibacterium diazotrophicum TaxID=1261403 RepID=A0A419VYK9_9BACT|nr:aminopeptidase P family protein [Mangrovibacterium diazotrophicum]RKD88327.1 Xaa-Pro aminopeptidase [Mangrovibacterium diazotrophicum]